MRTRTRTRMRDLDKLVVVPLHQLGVLCEGPEGVQGLLSQL